MSLKRIAGDIRKVGKGGFILDSGRSRKKLESELTRILYYMHMGYAGPHPWGSIARPPFPETSPLSVKDKEAGKEAREAIEKFLKKSQWSTYFIRLLRELEQELD